MVRKRRLPGAAEKLLAYVDERLILAGNTTRLWGGVSLHLLVRTEETARGCMEVRVLLRPKLQTLNSESREVACLC